MPKHPLMVAVSDTEPKRYQIGGFFEFDATKPLDINAIQNAYEQASCFVMRNVFDSTCLSVFYERAKIAYEVRDWQFERGELSEHYLATMYYVDHIYPEDMDDPTKARWQFFQLFEQSCLRDVVAGLLGPNAAMLINFCNPRRQRPLSSKRASNPVPFHQDGAFMDKSSGVINFWTPLIDCGVKAPGLEVVTCNPGELLDPVKADGGAVGVYRSIDLSEEYLAERYGRESFWAPELNCGDVLVFTEKTLHRTHITPEMDTLRISAELRCGDPTTLSDYIRPMVQTRSFL